MDEVQKIGRRRSEALDPMAVDSAYGLAHLVGGGAAVAGMEKASERLLIGDALVDVGNAQLGLPQEGVVGTLEDLPLLGDRANDGSQRRTAVGVAKRASVDLADHLALLKASPREQGRKARCS